MSSSYRACDRISRQRRKADDKEEYALAHSNAFERRDLRNAGRRKRHKCPRGEAIEYREGDDCNSGVTRREPEGECEDGGEERQNDEEVVTAKVVAEVSR